MTRDQQDALSLLADHPDQYGRMLGYGDLAEEPHGCWLRDMILGAEDRTLMAHRGSFKTTCLGVSLPAIMMLRPEHNLLFFRKTDGDVKEVIRQVRRNVEHPVTQELHRMLYDKPLRITASNATAITTDGYAAPRGAEQLLGLGIKSSITGKHADEIFTDDIVNITDRLSPAEREDTRIRYQELQNVRNPGGRIYNTCTPWHPEDAISLMPAPWRFDCYSTGLLSPAKLDGLRQGMAASLFAANYELRHIAAEDALFPEPPTFTEDERELWDGMAQIDAAYGGGDGTALTCMRRAGDVIYAYGRLYQGHVDTAMGEILATMERLRCAPCYVETNGDKGYLAKELRTSGVQVRPYQESQNKYYKIATHLKKWWAHIVWLRGTDPKYLSQIQGYNAQAQHDDAPDSAASLCRVIDRRG